MQRICKFFWMLGLLSPAVIVQAGQVQIIAVNYSDQPTNRVAFDLSGVARYRVFTLSNPNRLVVDFDNSHLQAGNAPPADHPLFINLRSGTHNDNNTRIVLALKDDVDAKSTLIKQPGGSQLQIDLTLKEKSLTRQDDALSQAGLIKRDAPVAVTATVAKPIHNTPKPRGRDIIVAIDAGHGGKDVGAQGSNGTQEKDVVFAIAKRLESRINRQPGLRAVMIRKGDYFVYLRERVKLAQAAKADLLVSIHADAFNDPTTQGASVYTLSNQGASSQTARWLADSENASDGKEAEDRDDTLVSVLQDLSQNAAKEASQNVGSKVLRSVKMVSHLHRSTVQKAGFVVLKSEGIPSILVETAFISNPNEEQHLTSSAYQEKMAAAMFNGILAHFRQYAPANTLMAKLSKSGRALAFSQNMEPASDERPQLLGKTDEVNSADNKTQHVISSGETLSGIAQQYGVSMRALRLFNNMEDGNVKIGRVLQIPPSG